jgi:hypothetical protein
VLSDDDNNTEKSSEVFPVLASITVNEVSNKTYAAALMAILKRPPRKMEDADDVSCVSSVSSDSVAGEANPYLRKVFARSIKYSVPGSWAEDSDDE